MINIKSLSPRAKNALSRLRERVTEGQERAYWARHAALLHQELCGPIRRNELRHYTDTGYLLNPGLLLYATRLACKIACVDYALTQALDIMVMNILIAYLSHV